ncbi:MAG: LysR family transcriptional regulator [Eubacteriales bacterium]|jgi:DNA-binding transcriptional LysR family regulator
MNTTQLECFMAVANYLNFSKAGEFLRITQPAVSHQISALEDELGVKLFHRTSKSVRLTQEGFLFVQYAGEILKLSGLSKARMKESRENTPQRLVIGCRNTTELRLITPALEKLRTLQQDILPVLRLIPFDSMENLLEEGDIHVMFSFGKHSLKNACYQELVRTPAVCVCSETHPLAKYQELTVEQLQKAGRIATCHPPICPQDLFFIQSQVVGGRGPGQMLFCDNQEVVYTLVAAGYAFAILTDFPHAHLPGLRYIPLPQFEPLSFGAVYVSGEQNPILREFLTILTKCFCDKN